MQDENIYINFFPGNRKETILKRCLALQITKKNNDAVFSNLSGLKGTDFITEYDMKVSLETCNLHSDWIQRRDMPV